MQEDTMFDRVHAALDIQPPAGAYERLRVALNQKPVRPYRWPAFQTRWSKMGFRMAAGVALVALAVAILAAIFALHSASNNQVPAGTGMSITAYQKMIIRDEPNTSVVWSSPCDETAHSGCGTDATRSIPVVQKWINDLTQSAPPTRFAVVNAELLAHLTQNLAALRSLLAASQAGDAAAMAREYVIAVYAVDWTSIVDPGIASSHTVDATTYMGSVAAQKQSLDTCAPCVGMLGDQASACVTSDPNCIAIFDGLARHFATFTASLVSEVAPASFVSRDERLQSDLSQADAVLLSMRIALATNDQTGFSSGVPQLQRLKALIDQDAGSILQG